MDNKEFNKIFETLAASEGQIPVKVLLSILGGIVRTSEKDSEEVKKFAEALSDNSTEDVISKTVLFTCNSVIINLWNLYKKAFDEEKKTEESEEKIQVDKIKA